MLIQLLLNQQSQPATRPTFRNFESPKPSESVKQQNFPPSAAKSNVLLKSIRGDVKASDGDDGDDDDGAISSTSSEDEGFVKKA